MSYRRRDHIPFPYKVLAALDIGTDYINSIKNSIEKRIEETYGDIENLTDDMRKDIEHIIEVETSKVESVKKNYKAVDEIKQYYLDLDDTK